MIPKPTGPAYGTRREPFSQILTLFSRTEFPTAVRQHRVDRYAKGFSSWDQVVAMLFCQFAQSKCGWVPSNPLELLRWRLFKCRVGVAGRTQ